MKLFVFGLGFSATAAVNRLGASCLKNGGWVAATCRSAEKADTISAAGIRAHIFTGEEAGNEQMRADLQEATHILMSISPGDNDPVLAHHRDDIAASNALQWICLLYTSPSPRDQRGSRMPSSA